MPRVGHEFLLAGEVILDVALPAGHAAHFLARCVDVGVIFAGAVARAPPRDARQMRHRCIGLRQRADAGDERRLGHAQRERVRVVAVDARYRVADEFGRLRVGHRADFLEALEQLRIAVGACRRLVDGARSAGADARLAIRHHVARVAVQARAGLLAQQHPLRFALVAEHVRVPALLAVIERERVPIEDRPPHRQFVQVLERIAPAVPRPFDVHRSNVTVMLARVVLAPHRRVFRGLVDVHNAEDRLAGLAFALRDVLAQQHHHDRGPRHNRDRYAVRHPGLAHHYLRGP